MSKLRFKLDENEVSLDMNKLMFAEARAVENATGMTFKEVAESLQRGSILAVQAMAWVALKRGQPALKFTDLDDRSISEMEISNETDTDLGDSVDDAANPTLADPDGPAELNE